MLNYTVYRLEGYSNNLPVKEAMLCTANNASAI